MSQMKARYTVTRIATVVALAALASCRGSDGNIDNSTAPVLVPVDVRFLETLQVDSAGAPDNYVVRSNWSAEFDPDIDRDLAIESYQINDPTAWTGDVVADDTASRAAFGSVVADSASLEPSGPCELVIPEPAVAACTYQALDSTPFTILVRRFQTPAGQSVMVVLEALTASRDFITGDFDEVAPRVAADTW